MSFLYASFNTGNITHENIRGRVYSDYKYIIIYIYDDISLIRLMKKDILNLVKN